MRTNQVYNNQLMKEIYDNALWEHLLQDSCIKQYVNFLALFQQTSSIWDLAHWYGQVFREFLKLNFLFFLCVPYFFYYSLRLLKNKIFINTFSHIFGTSPVLSKLFISSTKLSMIIWVSVNKKEIFVPSIPLGNNNCSLINSLKSSWLNPFVISIYLNFILYMKLANLVKLFLF